MGKIQVTEGELKNLIAESVKEIIYEDWQTRQANKATKRQNRYDNTMSKINKINQQGNPAARETGKYKRLQRKAGRQAMKNGAAFQQQATDNANQLVDVRKNLNSICEALGITNGDANAAIQAAQKLTQENQTLQGEVTNLTNQINTLSSQIGQLTKTNQTLRQENQSLTAQLQKNANQVASVNNTVGNLNQMNQKAMAQNQTQPGLTRRATPGTAQA